MSKMAELTLYSPLQVDIIDRDGSGHAIPLAAVDRDQAEGYLDRIMNTLQALQPQEDARDAFTAPDQDWDDICGKIVSLTRTVELVNGRPYGVFTCRSKGRLGPDDLDALDWHCRDQWENGWGEGYAHCPAEGPGLGLYIHYWQDENAPLLTRAELEAAQAVRQSGPAVTEINKDTFWTLLAQAKEVCGQDQDAAAFWLTERLLVLGPEQILNFHGILHGYMELADKYGLWNAAIIIQEDDFFSDSFEDFRAWLIAQGKETYLAALADPDSLADVPIQGDCRFESLPYVGDMAYERLTGRMAYADAEPAAQQRLVSELRKEIVYGEGIEYPHEWSEAAAYLPRLTAQHLTPGELRACISRGHLWNHDDPGIQKARASAAKKKKAKGVKKKAGESR